MPTASPWIKQGAFPSCTRAPSKHSAVLSLLEQMGPIKVLASSTTSAKYPSTGTKSQEKNKPQRGSLLSVLKMHLRHVLRSWPGSVHPPRGWQDAPPIFQARTLSLYPGNDNLQSSGLHLGLLPLGSLFQHFPACSFTCAAAPYLHRSKSFTSSSAGKEDKEFHFRRRETGTSQEGGFFSGSLGQRQD